MRFDNVFRPELFRGIHDDEKNVGGLCYSQNHLMVVWDQNTCYKSEGRGNVKKQYTATKWGNCRLLPMR